MTWYLMMDLFCMGPDMNFVFKWKKFTVDSDVCEYEMTKIHCVNSEIEDSFCNKRLSK